ncbi:hypothetical protein NCAS_0E02700 [Naumovozyma castellii]|uniref:peptidyl-tRNA hydrolase n=1 Tax=Naumovozyma castellii TaxID=27288 RepID=G0VFS3_NAUCA|nr:hypothetical protein NCAS_0E02700 [Naumovozyma castellii CBS 4309]CCC70340.1 hypothetical protein NCAS_0E02700 [Naumovozyma castellii CBS 4309]
MQHFNANIPLLFGIATISLTTGYYLGQISPSLGRKDKIQEILQNCKEKATLEQQQYEEANSEENNNNHNDTNSSDLDEENTDSEEDEDIESLSLNDIPGEVRMALVIRQDLGMTKGKIAAQCCHAALACYRKIATDPKKVSYNPAMTQRWLMGGQAKITLKCPDKETMDELYAKAISLGVNASVIHDAGRTQIAAGSATVLGVGPAPKAVLDQITGELKLY